MAPSRKTVAGLARFYIKQNRTKLSVEQFVKDTGLAKDEVQKILSEFPEPEALTAEETVTKTAISAHQPIVREEDGVTVNTGAASQWADEVTKRMTPEDYVRGNQDRCYKPHPGKPSR